MRGVIRRRRLNLTALAPRVMRGRMSMRGDASVKPSEPVPPDSDIGVYERLRVRQEISLSAGVSERPPEQQPLSSRRRPGRLTVDIYYQLWT